MKRSLGLMLALVTTAGAAPLAVADSVRQIAETNVAAWNTAFAQGQVDQIVSLYADNAMLVQPNGKATKNAGEIREFWRTLIEKGTYAMDILDVRSDSDGSIVATATLSDLKTVQSPQWQTMKYRFGGVVYSVLKRQSDGSWKAQVQRWAANRNS